MLYLFLSLAQLALTPLVVLGIARFRRASQVFAFVLVAAISYNILAHIILEHIETFGIGALVSAGLGLIIFSYGDHYFFAESSRRTSLVFLVLVQLFLFLHAMTDGAALISVQDAHIGPHAHPEKLSQSVILHRLMFEAFLWKYFHDRFGHKAAFLVLLNIALGTVVGYFASRALFSELPAYFDLFEAFMGGALFHLVYDYVKETVFKIRHRHI